MKVEEASVVMQVVDAAKRSEALWLSVSETRVLLNMLSELYQDEFERVKSG